MIPRKIRHRILSFFYLLLSLLSIWGVAGVGHHCQQLWPHKGFPWFSTWWVVPEVTSMMMALGGFVWVLNVFMKSWNIED